MKIRTQLTAFLPLCISDLIDEIRSRIDPIQFQRIKPHITICYDDEILDVKLFSEKLKSVNHNKIKLSFGLPEEFDHGGYFLPSIGDLSEFNYLRETLLQDAIYKRKNVKPHITLLHPRNSKGIEVNWTTIPNLGNLIFEIDRLSLIEQKNEEKWEIINWINLG